MLTNLIWPRPEHLAYKGPTGIPGLAPPQRWKNSFLSHLKGIRPNFQFGSLPFKSFFLPKRETTVYQSINDFELLQKIISQDQAALSQLYDRYARIMFGLAFKILGSAEEAEEIVLDVLSYVWKKAATYNTKRGRVDGWLFLMVRSRAIDRWRKRQKYAAAVESSTIVAKAEVTNPNGTPDEVLMVSERRDRVLTAMNELPTEQRQVIEFAYYQGMSQSEIAAKMGTSVGTVKTRVRLGLSKLRGLLDVNE